ncbi:MAG: hypothetical protein G01um10148_952 [Parcubacteria group bacterium Gr01-1014_8]|nr:MAG: hypothetical protein G01um10148_952 [Parcubacteria group bacterium Gr01-1014_8]
MPTRTIAILLLSLAAIALLWFGPHVYRNVIGAVPLAKSPPALPADDGELPFKVPEGFAVSVYSDDTPGARVLARDVKGTLVASLMSEGRIVALPDKDGDKKADRIVDILTGLNAPHGILFRCDPIREPVASNGAGEFGLPAEASAQAGNDCRMYVAEEDVLQSYAYDPDTFTATLPKTLASFPTGGRHVTRTLLAHPDGTRLLIAVGSSCNACNETDARNAKILALDFPGSAFDEPAEFARGLRNTVFMAIHPVTGELWGTDMGRDLLGDDVPPDEVNIIKEGGNYGWPICYGKNIHDNVFDKNTYIRNPCMEPFETPSYIDLQAHSAPLGLAFIPEEGWPEDYWFDLLVAYHGSWNRSVLTGYKIVRIPFDSGGNPLAPVDFMTGFMKDGEVIGRPVDILVEPGGTMFVSDDRAGAIYRIFRTE